MVWDGVLVGRFVVVVVVVGFGCGWWWSRGFLVDQIEVVLVLINGLEAGDRSF